MTTQWYFVLTDQQRLERGLQSMPEETLMCDWLPLYFFDNDKQILIAQIFIASIFESLISHLEKALENKLQLHPSITKDIGYLWNYELHHTQYTDMYKKDLVYEENNEGHYFWVGQRYLVWSTPEDVRHVLSTWLYNDCKGAIILQITP